MSIGKRLIDLARSELNSLLDRAASRDDGPTESSRDPDEDLYQRYGMSTISDEELEAELERRRAAREAAAKARTRPAAAPSSARPRPSAAPPPRATSTQAEELRRAYFTLEVTPGADFEAVRAAYRKLMRKYHPDRHAQTPEKQKAATELAQKLTQAYKLLEKHLRK